MAPWPVWNRFFLDQKRTARVRPPRALLLDGGGRLRQFLETRFLQSQARSKRQALGRSGMGQPLQFQSRRARRLRRIRPARKTGNRSRAQSRANRLYVLPFADRPLRRRKSPRQKTPRPLRLLRRAHSRKNRRALQQAPRTKR